MVHMKNIAWVEITCAELYRGVTFTFVFSNLGDSLFTHTEKQGKCLHRFLLSQQREGSCQCDHKVYRVIVADLCDLCTIKVGTPKWPLVLNFMDT